MKIVFLDKDTIGEDVSLESISSLGELTCYGSTCAEEVLDRAANAQVIITNKVRINSSHLQKLKNLKLICVAATGMNNIDLESCEEKGVVVKNVKGYSTESVAQITLAMVLSLSFKLASHSSFGAHQWAESSLFTTMKFPFSELKSKRWGIIGLGSIGKRVAVIAQAFGCEVLYYSTTGRNRDQDFQRADLEDVLSCDVISIHCPLNEMTQDLIHKENLHHLNDEAILINVARGGIVNEKAISEKFKNSNIRLGFDVSTVEPIEKESPLLEIAGSDRFLLTPHIAWASREARTALIEGLVENIRSFKYSF